MTYFKEHVTLSSGKALKSFYEFSSSGAVLEREKSFKMPERCVAARCNNVADPEKGISMHRIPFFGSDNPTAQRRRKKWIDFVLTKRKLWKPGKTSSLCSVHFSEGDFNFPLNSKFKRSLKVDEIGVCVFPTIHTKDEVEEPPSKRDLRMQVRSAKYRLRTLDESGNATETVSHCSLSSPSTTTQPQTFLEKISSSETSETQTTCVVESDSCADTENNANPLEAILSESSSHAEKSTQTLADQTCSILTRETELLKGQLNSVRESLKKCKGKKRLLKHKVDTLTHKLQDAERKDANKESEKCGETSAAVEDDGLDSGPENYGEEDDADTIEEEPDFSNTGELFSESGEETETESEEETNGRSVPLSSNRDMRTEPKYIVFLSKLLLLFQFCYFCGGSNPVVTARQTGTSITIKAVCMHSRCRKEFMWSSQPVMPGTKIPAGNFLICMATLFAGGSFTKVRTIFLHMGLTCVSLNTFFKHQRNLLFPTIYLFWKKYQANLFAQLKALGNLSMAGDGRHDSMGHCAKYCAYTIFCCTLPRIIHFALVQRNEAGNSPGMEFMGFQRCMDFLLGCGLVIGEFISDRHTQIASHMKNVLTHIKHYFDLWHLKKKITKLLSKICKEKGNDELQAWVKPCKRHLYWSATSTSDGNGKVIWAKFKSFLSHVVNKHTNLDDPLFNKCAHGDIPHRTWINPDNVVYDKMKKALTSDSLKKGIMQASPSAQTDCLEGFHSVLNFFAPKIIAYSYLGMYCRHILAALHFNFNLHREDKVNKDGSVPLKVTYPKFKNGEATVRNQKIEPNYDYVGELFQFYMTLTKQQLQDACNDLKEMVPEPMNTMLEKQPKEEAIRKWADRMNLVTRDVPPTAPPVLGQTSVEQRERPARARPVCSVCKNPMRGHSAITDCPRNRKEK